MHPEFNSSEIICLLNYEVHNVSVVLCRIRLITLASSNGGITITA